MEKERKILQSTDPRPAYEAPRALRLGNGPDGLGQQPPCANPGSSAADCTNGTGAATYCIQPGSTADVECSYDGSAADTGTCLANGVSAAAGQCVDMGSNASPD